MRAHVDNCLPLEGCGLLAGTGNLVQEVIPIPNEARSLVRFRMDPKEQLRAFKRMEDKGLVLLGIFHSHPVGPEQPSATDIAEAAYHVNHLIWSHEGETWKVHSYLIEDGHSLEVELYGADGK